MTNSISIGMGLGITGSVGAPSGPAVVPDTPHRYWRMLFNGSMSSTSVNVAEMEWRETASGADATGSGTASASSILGGSAAEAFDNNAGTTCHTGIDQWPPWIKYDFGVGQTKNIVEMRITAHPSNPGYSPTAWNVQYSDDNVTWTTSWSVFTPGTWIAAEVRTFTKPTVSVPARYWRINVTADNGGTVTVPTEIELRSAASGADQTGSGTAIGNMSSPGTWPASNAFDNNTTTLSVLPTTVYSGAWIGYDFGSGVTKDIVQITWRNRNDGNTNESPKDFQIQYSDNQITWKHYWEVVGSTAWALSETRTFTKP